MDSLKLQDVFEPYYAGRKRFATPRDQSAEARDEADGREAGKRVLRRALARTKTETKSTTEH